MAERKLPVVGKEIGTPPPQFNWTVRYKKRALVVLGEDGEPIEVFELGDAPVLREAADWLERANGIEPKRPLQWRPLPELTGESRYILVANTEHVASRIHYNSRASISVEQICLQQEGYEPTHFCELPELDSNETEPARPLQCRECRHFDNLVPGAICWKPEGLGVPKQDGTSSCSYAEPRESEGK